MRVFRSLVAVISLCALAAGCKNELTYAPPGGGLNCDAPGALCSVGYVGVGDDDASLAASLVAPNAIAFAPDGALLVADRGNNRIRRLDLDGNATTVAGTGQEDYGIQLGLPGSQTHAPSPVGVAGTDDGWVFWTDRSSCGIFGINPATGLSEHVAGAACSDNGIEGLPLNVYFSFSDCSPLRAVGNDLLISDTGGYHVKYWNRGSSPVTVVGVTIPAGEIHVIAGDGDAVVTNNVPAVATSVPAPCDALLAPSGDLYIAQSYYYSSQIRRVDPSGTIRHLAGASTPGFGATPSVASISALNYPQGLVLDPDAELLFVIEDQDRMRAINISAGPATWAGITVASAGVAVVGGFDVLPFMDRYLVLDSQHTLAQQLTKTRTPIFDAQGHLYLADPLNGLVRQIDGTTFADRVIAGYADGGSRDRYLSRTSGVAVGPDGSLFVTAHNPYVWQIDPDGDRVVFAGNGDAFHSGDGGDRLAAGMWGSGVTIDPITGTLLVSDLRNRRVRSIDASTGVVGTVAGSGSGGYGGDGGPAINAGMNQPAGIAVDAAGNLLIADTERVRFVNRGISTITLCNTTEVVPGAIGLLVGGGYGFAGDGADPLTARFRFNDETTYPTGLAVAGGVLYIADTLNHRIRALDLTTCALRTVVGSGFDNEDGVGRPVGVAVHDGYLYWTQVTGSLVRRMQIPNGAIETIGGTGRSGYSADGVEAATAQLLAPYGIAIAPDGLIYIADGSHRIRRIRP